jgi:phosphotransferase system enzyme I (PtsI)
MQSFKGIAVSPGIVIGRVFLAETEARRRVRRRTIGAGEVEGELGRFEAARGAAIAELNELHASARAEMGDEAAKIFLFHMGALSDRAILEPIRRAIREDRLNAEQATLAGIDRLAERFAAHADSTFRSKVNDLEDLAGRLVDHLQGRERDGAAEMGPDTVVVSRDLTPSQTAGFDRGRVVGMATDLGGPTSHTAIVARALGLPAVVGCMHLTEEVRDGQAIAIDGTRGVVVLDPDEATVERLTRIRERRRQAASRLDELAGAEAVTTDGVRIELVGNIEFAGEAGEVVRAGGSGVGLYRTEFLFLTSEHEPSEQEHFDAYREAIGHLGGRPLTIRTFDLGADKYTQERAETPERNPFLGLRSIRYSLTRPEAFRAQIRAVLRASALGPVRLMFPLVTTIGELRHARMVVRDCMEDLAEDGLPFDAGLSVGMMVEVPSAAIQAPAFAREADFLSIGTNDLVQYTLAVDRTNERVAPLYLPMHPAVLKLIRDVVRAGERYGRPVSCCGEAASDPEYAALLIGLGVRTLSVTAGGIPALKRMVRGLSADQCGRIARKAIGFDSEQEVSGYVRDRLRKLFPDAVGGRTADDL